MSHKVLRTFHPIGQGAFYSERHDDFNIVYDCGSMPLSSYTRSVVRSAFTETDDIDILFISHFDYDHVSAISVLMSSVRKIKRVVLPLLHEEHKNLLININRALSQNIVKLLKDPQSFFGKDTVIVFVKPAPPQDDVDENKDGDLEQIDLREIHKRINRTNSRIELASGAKLSLGGMLSWVFIPYNFCNTNRSYQLESALKAEGFNVKQLKSDLNYSLTAFSTPTALKALRKVYSLIDGNVNENSMLLYSGPDKSNNSSKWCVCYDCFNDCSWPHYCINRPGCIYTGDSDLNKINLGAVYTGVVFHVGVLQIPHHGSKHNFSIHSLNDFWPHVICPISFGTKNNYGHPAFEIVNCLSQQRFVPLLITEQSETKFIQEFFCRQKN